MTESAAPAALGRAPYGGSGWSTSCISGLGGFTAIAAEWDELAARCGSATPFQVAGWLLPWWRHLSRDESLRVVLVRHDGRVVAGAALMLQRRGGLRVLAPVGCGLADVSDVLIHDAFREEAAVVLASAIDAIPGGWHFVDLPEVPARAAAWELLRAWPRRGRVLGSSVCLEVAARPLEDLLAEVPRVTRKSLRRRLRRVAEAGVECRMVDPSAIPRAVGTMLDLHALQWEGREVNPEHLSTRVRAMFTESVTELAARGHVTLVEYVVEGRVMGSELFVVGPDWLGSYFLGVSPALLDLVDVTALTLSHGTRMASDMGRPALSMMRGDEQYKLRWRPNPVPHRRILLCAAGVFPAAAGGAAEVRSRTRRWLIDNHPGAREALCEVRGVWADSGFSGAGRVLLRHVDRAAGRSQTGR